MRLIKELADTKHASVLPRNFSNTNTIGLFKISRQFEIKKTLSTARLIASAAEEALLSNQQIYLV